MLTPFDPTPTEAIVPKPDNDKVSLPTVFEKLVNADDPCYQVRLATRVFDSTKARRQYRWLLGCDSSLPVSHR